MYHKEHVTPKDGEESHPLENWQGEDQPPYDVTTKGSIVYTVGKFMCLVTALDQKQNKHLRSMW